MNPTNSAIFNDPRAKRWGNFAKYGTLFAATLVGGFLIAPFIWVALGGLLGLIAAALVFGASILIPWMTRHWVYSVAANMRLKLVKAEARKNPVETLEETLRSKYVELNDRKDAIERLGGKIRTFADKVDEVKSKLGEGDSAYVKMFQDLQNLRRILVRRSEKWNEAKQALVRFADEIERARVIWEAGLAAAEAREQSGLTEDEFFAKLKTDTALDAIQDAYNQALGSLDSELLEDGITPALSAGASNTINVTPSKSKINA